MLRFSKDGKYAYLMYELLNAVEVYQYSVVHDMPVFEKIQTISTVSKKDGDACAASGMELTKSGTHLFCSNSGVNSIVCFEVDQKTGLLTRLFETRVNSDYPKMLEIYPDERHFLTLNNNSNDIYSYKIDYENKYSLVSGPGISVDKPNCIYIMELPTEE